MSTIVPNPKSAEAEAEVVRKAKAALVARLTHFVDLTTLSEASDDEFDYRVNVPTRELHQVTQRISEVEYDVNQEFGVWVRIFAIPVAG